MLPFPPPGDRPDPGIEPASLASTPLAGGFLTTVPPGKPMNELLSLRVREIGLRENTEGGGANFGEFNIQLSKCMCN